MRVLVTGVKELSGHSEVHLPNVVPSRTLFIEILLFMIPQMELEGTVLGKISQAHPGIGGTCL